jgi:prepilin-type N-terminal cleavage/methylation domain-containing protein
MQPLLLFFYRWLWVASNQHQRSKRSEGTEGVNGFTLMELLISLVVAGIIMAGLLTMIVQITTADKRESNLDQVQRDMNRAMEYITDDLQEAVYVYPDPQQMATQLAADPNFPDAAGEVPVLAFWRIDPIEEGLTPCNPASTGLTATQLAMQQQCRLLNIRQAAYTLVVYVQKVNDANANWSGQSRIIRYELSKYSNLANLTERSLYRDPTNSIDTQAPFEVWQAGSVTTTGGTGGSAPVLIDYVQAPTLTPTVALNRAPLNDAGGACRGYGLDANNNPMYTVVPSTATTTANNSFFACVRNPALNNGLTSRGNQDVYLFLRGNVQGVSGGVRGYSNRTSLPILETQVLVKGVVNKGFNQ